MDPIELMFEAIEQKTILLMKSQEEQTGVIRAMTENQVKALMVPVRTFLGKTTPEMKEQHEALLLQMRDLLDWATMGHGDYLFKYHWKPRPYTKEELRSYLCLSDDVSLPYILLRLPEGVCPKKANNLANRLFRVIVGNASYPERTRLYSKWYEATATVLDAEAILPGEWYSWGNCGNDFRWVFLGQDANEKITRILQRLNLDHDTLFNSDGYTRERFEVIKELEKLGVRALPNIEFCF